MSELAPLQPLRPIISKSSVLPTIVLWLKILLALRQRACLQESLVMVIARIGGEPFFCNNGICGDGVCVP